MAILASAEVSGDLVNLTYRRGTTGEAGAVSLLLFWLRDHCACAQCRHPEAQQRLLDTFALPADITARSVCLADGGRALAVTWADGHQSLYGADELAFAAAGGVEAAAEIAAWDDARIQRELPQIGYADFMANEAALTAYLEKLERYGFCFLEGAPATPEATQAVATRIAYIRETIFGGYWDFTANLEHKDTAYTTLAIGPHTDSTYNFDAPGYQMFHCLGFDGVGGESVFVDGFKIAEIMRRDTPELYRTLTEIEVPSQYLDHDKGIHLLARRPLFRLDSQGRLAQVSYNNLDRASFALEPARMRAFYEAYGCFTRLANDRALQYRRQLLPGAIVLFDNWRVLHARDAYAGYRRLAGAYLNKEDVESRLRVLRLTGKAAMPQAAE
jgi:trimethyllysine dioxygenase